MARTSTPAPDTARSAADAATDPASAPGAPAADDSPAVAVVAALSAEPGGATVAVFAGRAGLGVVAARQALIAHEEAGTETASRAVGLASPTPGIPLAVGCPARPGTARRRPRPGHHHRPRATRRRSCGRRPEST
jgi:hypothetical protein